VQRAGTTTAALAARSAVARSCGSPRALARALEKAGHTRPKGAAVHHIVAANAKNAKPARKLLRKFGIGLDDAVNGVFLPATRKSPNSTGAAVHSTLHTKEYYKIVNQMLEKAKSKADAEGILRRIHHSLLAGGL
jgi:hypothetical protein